MRRQRLPDRRRHQLIDFRHGDFTYTAAVGFFSDGGVAEILLEVAKIGTAVETTVRDAAILASLPLQHGASVETIRHALARNGDGSASGAIGALLDTLSEVV